MTAIEQRHIESALGKRGAQKARKRRAGGDANDNGHAYERAFTMNAILKEMLACLESDCDGTDIQFTSQPLGFIDDLAIDRMGIGTDYFELKSSLTQRCTTALKYNIVRQQQILVGNNLAGTINLVLNPTVARASAVPEHDRRVPITIRGFVENYLVDYKLIDGVFPDPDDAYLLATLRALLLGAWYKLGRDASIDDINVTWRLLAMNRISSTSPIGVSDSLLGYFAAIGLELRDERDVLRYRINNLKGLFFFQIGSEKWKEFENHLLDAWPENPIEVDELIERFNHG